MIQTRFIHLIFNTLKVSIHIFENKGRKCLVILLFHFLSTKRNDFLAFPTQFLKEFSRKTKNKNVGLKYKYTEMLTS